MNKPMLRGATQGVQKTAANTSISSINYKLNQPITWLVFATNA